MRNMSVRLLAAWMVVAVAQASLAASRADDLVEVRDDKFTMNEYSLCTVERPPTTGAVPKFQLQTYSEAPATGVISRDNFVAYTIATLTLLRAAFAQRWGLPVGEAFNALDCDTLAEPIGTVDLVIRIFMTAEGVQVEFTDSSTGKVSRITEPWED